MLSGLEEFHRHPPHFFLHGWGLVDRIGYRVSPDGDGEF